jgi:hypothetical protein
MSISSTMNNNYDNLKTNAISKNLESSDVSYILKNVISLDSNNFIKSEANLLPTYCLNKSSQDMSQELSVLKAEIRNIEISISELEKVKMIKATKVIYLFK